MRLAYGFVFPSTHTHTNARTRKRKSACIPGNDDKKEKNDVRAASPRHRAGSGPLVKEWVEDVVLKRGEPLDSSFCKRSLLAPSPFSLSSLPESRFSSPSYPRPAKGAPPSRPPSFLPADSSPYFPPHHFLAFSPLWTQCTTPVRQRAHEVTRPRALLLVFSFFAFFLLHSRSLSLSVSRHSLCFDRLCLPLSRPSACGCGCVCVGTGVNLHAHPTPHPTPAVPPSPTATVTATAFHSPTRPCCVSVFRGSFVVS